VVDDEPDGPTGAPGAEPGAVPSLAYSRRDRVVQLGGLTVARRLRFPPFPLSVVYALSNSWDSQSAFLFTEGLPQRLRELP
jgi:hypothetical protein